MFPGRALSQRLALAERAIAELLHDQLIELYRGSWRAHQRVPDNDLAGVLREWTSWVATADGDLVFYCEPADE
jgi:hypothetical protein